MRKSEPIIALDLGGTNLRVALTDRRARIKAIARDLTRPEDGPERVAGRMAEMARRLLHQHGHKKLLAVGAALASPLSREGVMLRPPSLPGWGDVPMRAMMEERLGVPVFAGNDATLGALGEHVFGAGQGVDDLVYMTLSTGVGGGAIVNGEMLLGVRGLGAELGHIIIDRHATKPYRCGHAGCLESLVSGTAIALRAIEGLRSGKAHGAPSSGSGRERPSSAIAALAGGIERVTAVHVFQAAAQGDGYARELVEAVGRDLGLGLASILHVFNPRLIVLGGGVSKDWPALEPVVWATLRRTALPGFLDGLRIERTRFGDDVGVVGAVALVLQGLRGRGASKRRRTSGL